MHPIIIQVFLKSVFSAIFFGILAAFADAAETSPSARQIISLNGTWEIAEGTMDQAPDKFGRTISVSGLIDMATPAFAEVGTPKSGQFRKAFWYRRSFTE